MRPQAMVAALLLLAVALGIWRARRLQRPWTAASVWMQPLSALAFYLLLFPPSVMVAADTLRVLTPGASRSVWSALSLRPTVALPGAQVAASIERAPDLATALRRHPQTRSLQVSGDGLPPRDRDGLAALGLRFEPAAEHGLLELDSPGPVALGTQWPLRGRVAAAATQVALHDPSGAIVDSTRPDAQGRFALSALARAPGPARFELRLLDAKQALIETASVPVIARTGVPLNVILRVGAPDPEFKYWRRWASDAGIVLRLRAGLSENVDLRDGDTALSTTALAQTDLLIVDERAWTTLDASEKAALSSAVRNGLGLLLRIGGPVDAAVAADWALLGVTVQVGETHGVTLDRRSGLRDRASFTAAPVTVAVTDGVPLVQADDGEVLARWRSEGRGRIGSWWLLDSYRLGLLGEPARYGALWSQSVAALSRPQPGAAEPQLPGAAWIDERSTLCGLGATASVIAPDGRRDALIVEQGCAALWPAQAGWYAVQTEGAASSFYVRAADDGSGLRAARDRRETLRRVQEPAVRSDAASISTVLPRWPLLLLWLLIAAGLWWRERPDS